jgi:hypothetical protein
MRLSDKNPRHPSNFAKIKNGLQQFGKPTSKKIYQIKKEFIPNNLA